MKEYARNVAVGLTVLVALGLLCGLILIFAIVPTAFRSGYPVTMMAPSTQDIHKGDAIHLAGIRVGQITDVRFDDPKNPKKGIRICGRIDREIRLPGNTVVMVFSKPLAGSAYIELKAEGPPRTDPKTGQILEFLPTDGSILLAVVHKQSGLIPDELREVLVSLKDSMEALEDIGALARSLNEAIALDGEGEDGPAATTGPAGAQPAGGGLKGAIWKLNRTLDGLLAIVGEPENQTNLKTLLTNLADTTRRTGEAVDALKEFAVEARKTAAAAEGTIAAVKTAADQARERLDEVSRKFIDSAEQLSALLATANKAVTKIESGEGTAGRLLNDPKLYNNLLESTKQLADLLKEFRRLVRQWQETGLWIRTK